MFADHGVEVTIEGEVLGERDLHTTTTEQEEPTLRSCTYDRGNELIRHFAVPCTEGDVRGQTEGHIETRDEVTPIQAKLIVQISLQLIRGLRSCVVEATDTEERREVKASRSPDEPLRCQTRGLREVRIGYPWLKDELDTTEAIRVHITIRARDCILCTLTATTEVDIQRSLPRPVVELVPCIGRRSEVAVVLADIEDNVLPFERESDTATEVELHTDTTSTVDLLFLVAHGRTFGWTIRIAHVHHTTTCGEVRSEEGIGPEVELQFTSVASNIKV